MLELRRLADGRVQHLHTTSKAIGFESSRTHCYTDILVIKEIRWTLPLTHSIDVLVLSELARVGSGALGSDRIQLEPLDTVTAVVC